MNKDLIYIYIEDKEYTEYGVTFAKTMYVVLVDMPFDTTFDSVENIHYQYDLNITNT
jgi:hypothetical protein